MIKPRHAELDWLRRFSIQRLINLIRFQIKFGMTLQIIIVYLTKKNKKMKFERKFGKQRQKNSKKGLFLVILLALALFLFANMNTILNKFLGKIICLNLRSLQ